MLGPADEPRALRSRTHPKRHGPALACALHHGEVCGRAGGAASTSYVCLRLSAPTAEASQAGKISARSLSLGVMPSERNNTPTCAADARPWCTSACRPPRLVVRACARAARMPSCDLLVGEGAALLLIEDLEGLLHLLAPRVGQRHRPIAPAPRARTPRAPRRTSCQRLCDFRQTSVK